VLLVIKGKDEDRKFFRQGFYNIARMMVKNMPPVEEWMPVAYENEVQVEKMDMAQYEANMAYLNSIEWPKN